MTNSIKFCILEQEKQHISEIMSKLERFSKELHVKSFDNTETMSFLGKLTGFLVGYNDSLYASDRIDLSFIRKTQLKLSRELISIKAYLFSDISIGISGNSAEIDGGITDALESADKTYDLFTMMREMVNGENKVNGRHDGLFMMLEAIIKKQTLYTSQLSKNAIKDSFSKIAETIGSIAENLSGTNQTDQTIESISQSIVPVLTSCLQDGRGNEISKECCDSRSSRYIEAQNKGIYVVPIRE